MGVVSYRQMSAFCLMEVELVSGDGGTRADVPEGAALTLLASCPEAGWGIYEFDSRSGWVPLIPVDEELATLIQSAKVYPPALALAREEVAREPWGEEPTRIGFTQAYASHLRGFLRGHAENGFALAEAVRDAPGITPGSLYWVARVEDDGETVLWVSSDYRVCSTAASDFKLSAVRRHPEPWVCVEHVELALGAPVHGWVPINMRLGDFELACSASLVLNDPLEELADFALFVRDGCSGVRRVCFWTEPEGYALDVRPMKSPDVGISLWHDPDFVPPMTGHAMKSVFRCVAPRRSVYEALAGALSSLLEAQSKLGDGLAQLREREAQLARTFPAE